MKTIQEHLKTCNRETIANIYITDHLLSDHLFLMRHKNETVNNIIHQSEKKIYDFIDRLISVEPVPSETHILLAVHSNEDIRVILVKESDIDKDQIIPYGYEFTPFAEALGFYVADTYLTQYYLAEVIASFLHEVSWTGYEQEHLEEEIEKLDASLEDFEKHKDDPDYFITHEELKKRFEEETGFEFEKHDPDEEEAYHKLIRSEAEYNKKCIDIEIEKLKCQK